MNAETILLHSEPAQEILNIFFPRDSKRTVADRSTRPPRPLAIARYSVAFSAAYTKPRLPDFSNTCRYRDPTIILILPAICWPIASSTRQICRKNQRNNEGGHWTICRRDNCHSQIAGIFERRSETVKTFCARCCCGSSWTRHRPCRAPLR